MNTCTFLVCLAQEEVNSSRKPAMNGSVANKKHRESHDYDYDPLEVIVLRSFKVFCLELYFKPCQNGLRLSAMVKEINFHLSLADLLRLQTYFSTPTLYEEMMRSSPGSPKYGIVVQTNYRRRFVLQRSVLSACLWKKQFGPKAYLNSESVSEQLYLSQAGKFNSINSTIHEHRFSLAVMRRLISSLYTVCREY